MFAFMYLDYQCGGMFIGSKGNFTSPGYPDSTYPNNVECAWTISTTRPGSRVSVNVVDFQAQYSYSTCHYDYLRVRYSKVN